MPTAAPTIASTTTMTMTTLRCGTACPPWCSRPARLRLRRALLQILAVEKALTRGRREPRAAPAAGAAEGEQQSLRVGRRLGDPPPPADHALAPPQVVLVLRLDLLGRQVVLSGLHVLQRLEDVGSRRAGDQVLEVRRAVGGRRRVLRVRCADEGHPKPREAGLEGAD